ncbi:MAG: beta-lactamase family protein, partial [Flavobacteriaceae bacterium]|nr:beta-lactamase family protein [Flavobacteriaceae bacterium]
PLLLVISLLVSCNIKSQNNDKQTIIEEIVTDEISSFIKAPEFSALSGVIYVNGKTHQFHFGKLVNGKKPNNQTLYEIGSISKTYTGLLLSQAVNDEKVNLDADIRNYLKNNNYPNLILSNGPITLKHLATHTSGIPVNLDCFDENLTINEKYSCYQNYTNAVFLEKLQDVKLLDSTGESYNYSNAGIRLIGHILENVYKTSYQSLLKKYIFSRSKEQNTFYRFNDSIKNKMALGRNEAGEIMPLASEYYKNDGALKSSTNSMLKHIRMYMEEKDEVVQNSLKLLAGNPDNLGRSFVWNTFQYNTTNMYYHSGGTFGFSSWIALYPTKKTGIFLVTNVSTKNAQAKLNEVSNRIINRVNKL